MVNALLLVGKGYRLGTERLAILAMDFKDFDVRVNGVDGVANQCATLIDFGYDRATPFASHLNNLVRPSFRRTQNGSVFQDPSLTLV
jgi:hypothetical protein